MTATAVQLESALLRRVAAGDERALAALYDRLAPLAYGLALRIARDERLAQDAVQDAFLRAWRQVGQYDARRGTARAWLLRIVRNSAIDHVRSEQALHRAVTRASHEPVAEPTGAPDSALDLERRAGAVRSALAELPTEQRQMIEIAYFQGLSHSEIASREGIPLGTVKTRIRDGVLRLRRLAADGRFHG